MAILKHFSSKNADYGAAEKYLLFQHDEFTMKPVLDETGRLIPREEIEQLTTKKNALYCQYLEKKERVRQLQTVKGNIDQLLRRSEPQRGKRQDLDR